MTSVLPVKSRAIVTARSLASLPLFTKYVTSRPGGIFEASFCASRERLGCR
jgi:hypothetical protein